MATPMLGEPISMNVESSAQTLLNSVDDGQTSSSEPQNISLSGREISEQEDVSFMSPSPSSDGLLPPFSSSQCTQLPTPQSPNNVSQYVTGVPYTPESPMPYGSLSSHTARRPPLLPPRFVQREEELRVQPQNKSHQIMTPESSPLVPRTVTPTQTARPCLNMAETAPKPNLKLESLTTLAPAHRISSPSASSSEKPPGSRLSSPFMAKLSLSERSHTQSRTSMRTQPSSPSDSQPVQIDDVFSAAPVQTPSAVTSISTPPLSPLIQPPAMSTSGELERIRLAMLGEKMAAFQEAESRRPEYLKRTKRARTPDVEVQDGRDRGVGIMQGVGIMETPNKGRRLKLFQETSEESFEESLMAGGYGRYRTVDWVEQPTPGPPGASNVVEVLEKEATPSPKELRKRKRLAAFKECAEVGSTRLYAVEVEGKGRVLLDVPAEPLTTLEPLPPPNKKKGNRKKKKEMAESSGSGLGGVSVRNIEVEGPNWPDAEFPWRLRTEERVMKAKEEEKERLKWIERFLDRDTDDEDEGDQAEALPGIVLGQTYEDPPTPNRRGRGKMVPLKANPHATTRRRRAFFPSDPADAKAALLSKKSVRALSYRNQRRRAREGWDDDSDEEGICFCDRQDDDSDLVQCDACQRWYHLRCIGIRNIADLGNEEDPWYCDRCESWTPTPEPVLLSEPTFVPTDEETKPTWIHEGPFFHSSLPDSPMTPWAASRPPRTPTRGGGLGPGPSPSTSWTDLNRTGPSTPHFPSRDVRVNTTPGLMDSMNGVEESPFDPTSTPSRGIKFSGPFATPKHNMWSSRVPGLFQTPSRPSARSVNKLLVGSSSLSALDESGGVSFSPQRTAYSYDDTPIRRTMSSDAPTIVLPVRRLLDSPLASRISHSSEDPLNDTFERKRPIS